MTNKNEIFADPFILSSRSGANVCVSYGQGIAGIISREYILYYMQFMQGIFDIKSKNDNKLHWKGIYLINIFIDSIAVQITPDCLQVA